jgi:hypothetical protein
VYAEWLRRQGHRVIRTASSYWHSEGLRVYQAFPYHWLIRPSEAELQELFYRDMAVALRYSAPADRRDGTHSYHVTYTGTDYDFETLSAWARKNVRRGLRSCKIGPISFEKYIDDGWALRVDTLERQKRLLKESRSDWCKRYSVAAGLDGFEVWAAQVDNKLAATLVTFQMEDWYYMVYQQCHRDYLREHVNNALSFEVTQGLIRRPNSRGIFYGMRSLDAPPSVDEFKFRMGYEAKPVRERVAFHPYLAPLVNTFNHKLLQALASLSPKNRGLAKAGGMMRIYLEEATRRRASLQPNV